MESFFASNHGLMGSPRNKQGKLSKLIDLMSYFGNYKRFYLIGLALGIFDAVSQSAVPMLFRYVLNELQKDPVYFVQEQIVPILVVSTGIISIFFAAAYFFHVLTSVGAARFARHLQVKLYEHIQRLGVDFFHRNEVGEVTARLNGDIDALHGGMGMVSGILWGVVMLAQCLAMMFWIEWRLALLFIVLSLVVTALSHFWMPRIKRLNREVRDASGDISARVTEYIGLMTLIKSFSREDVTARRVRFYSDAVRKKREKLTWQQFLFFDTMQVLVRFVAPLLLLFVGAVMLSKDNLLIGDLVAFWGFWLLMGGTLSSIITQAASLFALTASVDRIAEFFREVPAIKDKPDAIALGRVKGDIRFVNVSFRYPNDRGGPVLNNINLTIKPGTSVALVGPSGAGKSTLMQLLLRFYDPIEGSIFLDGTDLRNLQQKSLRERVGVVLQDSIFFAGTIADNLRLSKPDATEEEMREALRMANALEFVEESEKGLETNLGERGSRLSGGQKQRLSIARVFLKNPTILLFDEATSALDAVSERLVKEALDRLRSGRTTITVAHRLSTVIDADQLVVFDKGHIVGQGTHTELVATCPLYRSMAENQGLA